MELELSGIVVVVGNCGSGKTEVSVNLALNQTARGRQVKVADLDLVNPYFRIREVRHFLSKYGVKVVLPPERYLYADLPILAPAVSGAIKNPPELLILDVGGGGNGSMVLGALSCFFERQDVQMFYVINPNRPRTVVDDCLKMRDEIEAAAKIRVTGIIGNANLINETTLSDIYNGYNFVLKVSRRMGVPVCCITVPRKKMSDLNYDKINCPILPLSRQLVPPWRPSESFV